MTKPSGGNHKPDINSGHAEDSRRDIAGNINVRGEIEAHLPKSLIKQYETANEESSTREKRQEARDKIRIFVEILTFVVIAVYTGLTWAQWSTANQSLQASAKQFSASERPWVSVDITSAQLVVRDNSITIDPSIATLSNVGHSVAKNVVYAPVLVFANEENGQECNRFPLSPEAPYPQGIVAFPGEKLVTYWPTGKSGHFSEDQLISMRLVGCVIYSSTIDDSVHRTRVVYFVLPPEPNTNPFGTNGVYRLKLQKDINGNSAE